MTNEIVEVYLTLNVVKYGNENHHPIKSIYHFFPRVVTLPAACSQPLYIMIPYETLNDVSRQTFCKILKMILKT